MHRIKNFNDFIDSDVNEGIFSKIARSFTGADIKTKQYQDFLLIIGKSSDIFDYFGVEELHGLKKSECFDNPEDAYIAGLCNQFPDDPSKQFLFINEIRIGRSYKDVLLIMHETMHLSLEVNGHNLEDGDKEEETITYAEEVALEICEYLKSIGLLKI